MSWLTSSFPLLVTLVVPVSSSSRRLFASCPFLATSFLQLAQLSKLLLLAPRLLPSSLFLFLLFFPSLISSSSLRFLALLVLLLLLEQVS